jgi:phosphoenolpyruvate carboxylase
MPYFRQATPIDQITELRIGSRPARRAAGGRIEDLRAIPWVFSWTQNRHGLPGWYGLGTAIRGAGPARGDGEGRLAEMYRHWPFFRSLIDNAQLSMGKADLAVARLYTGLVDDPEVRDGVFGAVEAEWRATEDAILAITGQPVLLGTSPVLRRSIQLRNPYVDPLSFVQVSLLRRLRQEGREGRAEDEAAPEIARRLVAQTINGIAAGLQNTG